MRFKVMNNECFAEEIKLADGEEQELRTLLDYKEGSIFEQDKQLNIIKKRKEYIERRLETPESKLKVKLVTRGKLINKIFKSKKSETQYFRTSLLMKAGREEALVEYKKEIELLQEDISITSEQLLMIQKGNVEKKDQCTQSLDTPTAESIYTSRIDYQARHSDEISFTEGEQLEIYDKRGGGHQWYGRSLVFGDEGYIPSSCVYSMLESLQLLEFILSVEESKLKVKLVTRGKLINKIFKSKKSETQYFRTSLLMKAGTESTGIICLYYLMTGREEALVEYKKEIELLQENISITSEQLLMSEKGNIESM
ncbi:PREDICTED: uncharacterized protein LOC109589219 [Amphimedon queenslandica]|uniref:SH3 domain-containing protein n=1 Tax=Amphimedon queenslandica TaxID=400682 RepID=A0AAN0JVG4_AMPQE|nr:PREDICTED: uncharacterized protein LOC109589219 [Amphimedon queenslandica]|eukprot:XP_019860888.1 PREDICTED: uncharacterized protein LOC109589219 [Amphimedon queenslandica]